MATQASMGFVGSVTFKNINVSGINDNVTVRATSADIRASQEITFPDVVDGRMDRTVYQLGPRIVEGNISFPLVHEGGQQGDTGKPCGTEVSHGQIFWEMATARDPVGRIINGNLGVAIRYTDNTAFLYPGGLINNMTMSVTQESTVDMSLDIIAGKSITGNVRETDPSIGTDTDFLAPARIVTWNDFVVHIYGDSDVLVSGQEIRSFEASVNNNAQRFYTLNNRLSPQDIAAGKRVIEGNVAIMGYHQGLSALAYTNDIRYTSNSKVGFGYTLGGSSSPVFSTVVKGVVFEIEEIAITNDLVETRVPWYGMADCECNYEATELGAIGSQLPSSWPNNTDCTSFGGPTSPAFPTFGS